MSEWKATKKQALLLDFVGSFVAENGFSPSYREIMAGLGLKSVSAVAEHVENCVEAGLLRRLPGEARSIEVVRPKDDGPLAEIFREKIAGATEEELEILLGAAKILGVGL